MPWTRFNLPDEALQIVSKAPSLTLARNVDDLVELAVRDAEHGWHEVSYDVTGKEKIVEARVCRTCNGIAANYLEPYMRRRDPDCMCIGDERPSNKSRFRDRFGTPFDGIRQEIFAWLSQQDLAMFPFVAGVNNEGIDAVVICPANAGFFAMGLALLQGMLDYETIRDDFDPRAVIYVAPPFRHTHFDGKQVVVHHRTESLHELFSYNLYPGPSAKKGVYDDAGAAMLHDFFKKQLAKFDEPDLDPLGRRIIDACLNHASMETYVEMIGAEAAVS
jgi:hypothetical protein